MTQKDPQPKRFIGLDVHKHYLIAIGVDEDLNQMLGPQRVKTLSPGKVDLQNAAQRGRDRTGNDHQHLAAL